MQTQTTAQKIFPCLWFDNQAEEAANFYVSIFNNSKVLTTTRYTEGSPGPAGSVMTVEFEIEGQKFLGLNGGPLFKFTEAVSFCINCESQEEIDYFWEKLTEGGEESMCGWLKDKFGLSWQVVSTGWDEMLNDPDPARAKRVMEALMKMRKIDIEALKRAYEQE
ncbi:MAG TPA: VOC family protein [Blastocatellia bacterium]|nr:VOC family protein [Blastocatellia bacterium]